MQFSFMNDPRWGDLDQTAKRDMIDAAFHDQVASDSRWNNLDDDTKAQMKDSYLQDAEAYQANITEKTRQDNLENRGDIARGFLSGIDETQGSLYGAGALLGSAVKKAGAERVGQKIQDIGMEGYRRNVEEASLNPTNTLDDIKGVGSAVDWVQGTFGKLIPSMATAALGSVTGAGLAGVGAKTVFKKTIQEMAERQIQDQIKKGVIGVASDQITKKTLANAITRQAMSLAGKTGMGAAVLPMEAGGNYASLLDDHGVDAPLTALGFGALSTSLEYLGGNSKLVDQFLVSAVKGQGSILKRTALELLKSVPAEAMQEAGQETFSILNTVVNTDERLLTPDNVKRLFESAAAGAVGGGAGGILSGAMSKPTVADIGVSQTTDDAIQAFEKTITHDLDQTISKVVADDIDSIGGQNNYINQESNDFEQFQEVFRDQKIAEFEQNLKQAQEDIQEYPDRPPIQPDSEALRREYESRQADVRAGQISAPGLGYEGQQTINAADISTMSQSEISSEIKRLGKVIEDYNAGVMQSIDERIIERYQDLVDEDSGRRTGKKSEVIKKDNWFESKAKADKYLASLGYKNEGDSYVSAGKPHANIENGGRHQGGFVVKFSDYPGAIEDDIKKAARILDKTENEVKRQYATVLDKYGVDEANRLLSTTIERGINNRQAQDTNLSLKDEKQRAFVDQRIQKLGSLEAVDKAYNRDDKGSRYARGKARAVFTGSQDFQNNISETHDASSLTGGAQTVKENLIFTPGAIVTWKNKKGESFSGHLVQQRPNSKSTWEVTRDDGKRVFLSERSFDLTSNNANNITNNITDEPQINSRFTDVPSKNTGPKTTYLNDNTPIEFNYEVIEADDLITSHDDNMSVNPLFPAELQPRERSRKASLMQVENIANKLNPARLGESSNIAQGAPMIGKDSNIVESGNGRTLAIRKAYAGGKTGPEYKAWLQKNADFFGLPSGKVNRMDKPILVRRRQTDIDNLARFTQQANEADTAKLSSTEQAIVDAGNLSQDDIAMFRPDQDGNIMAASNKGFIDLFLDKMSPEEKSGYLTEDGLANKQLVDRVQAAVFQKAYANQELLKLSAEEANPDIKNILNGLARGVSNFVKAKGLDDNLADTGIIEDIVGGIELLRRAKREYPDIKAGNGRSALQGQLRQVIDQGDLFGSGPSENVKLIAQFLVDNIRSGKRIGEFFDSIGTRLRAYISDLSQAELFGTKQKLTSYDLINQSKDFLNDKYEDKQGGLFEEQTNKNRSTGSETGDLARGNEGRDEDTGGTGESTQEVTQEENEYVSQHNTGTNTERDSGNTGIGDSLGEEDISDGSGPATGADGAGVRSVDKEGVAGSGEVSPGYEAPPVGKRGDQSVYSTDGPDGTESSLAGGDNDTRGGDVGFHGEQSDRIPAKSVVSTAQKRSDLESKIAAQKKAVRIKTVKADLSNIQETLPILHPGQQEDVFFAEKRFSKPGGHGVMFTNGTGTGKTFSALGIIKRFERDGKKNILVIAPDNVIINAWMKASKLFDLLIHKLTDTKDSGQNITITTYANLRDNKTLVSRDWDLVVADESHELSMNKAGGKTGSLSMFRAITKHPRGAQARAEILHPDLFAARGDSKKASEAWEKALDDVRHDISESQQAKAVFLSATPFAYEKNINYAEGYLFDYGPDLDDSGYNSTDAYQQFMVDHFGYRMRYNKLTEPDSEVDRGVMQRQFNSWLKKEGVLSSRVLSLDYDYDRKFILTESAVGQKIDDGFAFLHENFKKYNELISFIQDGFNYLQRRYLLEAIKAKESIPIIKDHLAHGRKVVVFHDYIKGGTTNPFDVKELISSDLYNGKLKEQAQKFAEARPDLVNLPIKNLSAPVETLKAAFPDILMVNGQTVSKKEMQENINTFNDDDSGPCVLMVQSDKDKGWSGHDTTGKHQRVLINLGLPTRPTRAIQQEGRIYRVGQASDAMFRYLNTGTNWERWAFASTIATRASAAENLAMGESARALQDAFIDAFEASDNYPAGMPNEGKGGKEQDATNNAALTEWDRAISFYFGQQKKTARTKAKEGKDYFATPEPLGLKMVEWAGIEKGDKILEPSAGHGAIARWFPGNVDVTTIEPSAELSSRLKMVAPDSKVIQDNFESHHVTNKYDAVIMNPPFGSAGKTAMEHVEKAFKHLRHGGRVVAIIPNGPAMEKRLDKFLYGEDDKGKLLNPNAHLVADFILPAAVFERAGTKVGSRVVVIDKAANRINNADPKIIDFSDAKDIKEFFERIQDVSVPANASEQSNALYSISSDKPWPKDFPNVTVHTTANKVAPNQKGQGGHPDHKAAKAGDVDAANRLVFDLVKPEKVLELKKQFPDAMVVPVHAVEEAGRNKIPRALARAYGEIAGFKVDLGIVQINKSGHTRKDAAERIISRAEFDGDVIPGQEYIILDDIITTGETLSELRHYIENNGGRVVAASTLGYSKYSTVLAVKQDSLKKIQDKFNVKELEDALKEFNIAGNIQALTNSEAKYILSFRTVDAFRNRILEAGRNRSRQSQFSVFQGEVRRFQEETRDNSPQRIDTLPGQGLSTQDIQKHLKGQQAFLSPDGSISIRFKNGKGCRIKNVEHIGGDDIRFAIETGRMGEDGIILGKYQNHTITLNKNFADLKTLIHEIKHFLDDIGVITKLDNAIIDSHMQRLVGSGKYQYEVTGDKLEDRANTLAQMISDREIFREKSSLHRIVQKVMDFLDGLVHIGRMSERKLAREFESGNIYSRDVKNESDMHLDGAKYSIASDVSIREKKDAYSQIAAGLKNIFINRKNMGPNYKQDIGVIENTLGLMSHYSEKIPALKRTFDELLKRPEWKFQKENELSKNGEESMIGTIDDLRKHNKSAYQALNTYLVKRDINQVGSVIFQAEDGTWTIKSEKDERTGKRKILEEGIATKKEARDIAIEYEVDGYPDQAGQDALRAFRKTMVNLHDHYAESMEAIIKEYEDRGLTLPPVVTMTKTGEVRIDLKVALAQMGDRVAYYFPRQRSAGDWRVVATKNGEHKFIDYRDNKITADYLAGKKKAEGYDVVVDKPGSMSEDIYQNIKNILSTQALVNQAISETKMDTKVRTLSDLGISGEWRGDNYHFPNGGVYEWSSSVLKDLGGREYSDYGKNGRSWSPGYWFEKAPKDIEEIATNAIYAALKQEKDVAFQISENIALQLADTLRARGSRARMISRTDAIGKDVSVGYETDLLKATAQAVNSAAGGYAKQQVALNTSKAITGQHYSWNEWQEQHKDYGALKAAEDHLKSLQKNSETEEGRIADIDTEIKELQRERAGVETESEKARQDRLFRIGKLFREKEKIRKWTDDKQAAVMHREIARIRGNIHKEYRQYVRDNRIDPKQQKRALSDAINAVENVLKNDEAGDRVINTLKGLASIWFLGGRLSSAAINLTALGTTVPAAMDAYGGIPLRRTIQHIVKAGKIYASFVTGKGNVSKDDRAVLEDIFSRGWVAAQLNMETINALKSGPAQKYGRAVELLMTPFKITEEFNRGTTILAAYKGIMAENPGMSREDALLKAKKVSDRAHGIYGVENQPALLRKGRGLRAASAMYIFQTFMHNYFTTLAYMIGRKQAKAATYMILSPMVFGGAASSVLMPAVKMIFKALDEDDPEEKIYQIAENLFGETGGDVARYGLPGLAGISLKGSLTPNLPDFQEPLDALGPIGGMMRNIYDGAVNLTHGDYLKGVEKITPLAMGNIAKAYREASQGVTTRAGDPVFFGREQIKGDIGSSIMRAAGLNPTKIAKPREIQFNETLLIRQYADRKRKIYNRVVQYHAQPITKKDPMVWQDILLDVKEFNARVKSHELTKIVPLITTKTIRSRVRRALRPTKKERQRSN